MQQEDYFDKYISLQDSSRFCNHSQEYLSLRARQGKLRAIKLGRNWATKREWLEEYLRSAEEYNNNIRNNHNGCSVFEPPYTVGLVVSKTAKKIYPPENLPVEDNVRRLILRPSPKVRPFFIVALVFLSLVTEIFFGQDSFKYGFEVADPYVARFNQSIRETEKFIAEAVFKIYPVASVKDTFLEYVQKFLEEYRSLNILIEEKISKSVNSIIDPGGYKKETIGGSTFPAGNLRIPTERAGVVVFPVAPEDNVDELKRSFSDEVKIIPDESGTAGIIEPIFKNSTDQKYFYLMVPIKQ